MKDAAIQKITYHFGDSSTSPQYHRSYTITLTVDRIEVVVDSYGDVLATKTHGTTKEQFKEILLSLKRTVVFGVELGENDGCMGGTSETLSVHDGEGEVLSGGVYHCGGRDSGDLGGDVKSFADDIKKLAPDLPELLK